MVVMCLECHKERVVGKPMCIVLNKPFVCSTLVTVPLKESCVCLSENGVSCVEEPAVVDSHGIVSAFAKLLLGKKAVLRKDVKVYKIGVACHSGGGLIGTVAIRGGVKRQNLPAFCPRVSEEVDEIVCTFTKGADSVCRGKRAYRHQYSAFMSKAKVLLYVNHNGYFPFRVSKVCMRSIRPHIILPLKYYIVNILTVIVKVKFVKSKQKRERKIGRYKGLDFLFDKAKQFLHLGEEKKASAFSFSSALMCKGKP